jgi:alpha-L-fucosidase 2
MILNDHILEDHKGAVRFGEAYPIGNGHLGAMIYGACPDNEIVLSENTFFSGEKNENNLRDGAAEAFGKMRKAASAGDYARLHAEAENFIGIRNSYGTNLPAAKLHLQYENPDPAAVPQRDATPSADYRRSLDIRTGIVTREFSFMQQEEGAPATRIREEYFASWPDNVLCIRIESSRPVTLAVGMTGMTEDPGDFLVMPGMTEVSGNFVGVPGMTAAPDDSMVQAADNATVLFQAHAYETMHCDKRCGVSLIGALNVITDGMVTESTGTDSTGTDSTGTDSAGTESTGADGTCSRSTGIPGICVEGMRRCQLFIIAETDYEKLLQDPSWRAAAASLSAKDRFARMRGCYAETLRGRMDALVRKGYEPILAAHLEDSREDLGDTALQIDGHPEIGFLYAYGRYLLHASSRQNSRLPAHLQGVFNDNVACRIGWTCDMHLDINTQMNYWIADMTGMTGDLQPLFRWMKDVLATEGRKTARGAYGLRGWVGELVSNPWGYAAPYWAVPLSPCPTSGFWALTQMWEHYRYTGDLQFLRDEAFPLIREAAEFFTDYVFEENGYLTCGPSISPENSFTENSHTETSHTEISSTENSNTENTVKYQLSNGCTYEILMIRELFSIYCSACETLCGAGKEDRQDDGKTASPHEVSSDVCAAGRMSLTDADKALYDRVKAQKERLLPYRILEDGTIAEYAADVTVPDRQHRHTSHLLGVFPFAQITPGSTPELAEAVEKTIQRKLTPEEGWEDTGWARSMLLLYEARLGHAEEALRHVRRLSEGLLEPNGMVYHPPTRGAGAFDHVYELDGNTGLCAGITEMLVQSHEPAERNTEPQDPHRTESLLIRLLPALPQEWGSGRVQGIRARGGIVLSMRWENGELQEAQACALNGGTHTFCYRGKTVRRTFRKGETLDLQDII